MYQSSIFVPQILYIHHEMKQLVMKMKKVWILAIMMMLAIPSVAVLASASPMTGDMTEDKENHYIGSFNYNNGVASGYFVDFTINPVTGEIKNYTVSNTTVFTSVSYVNETQGRVTTMGAILSYYGVGSTFSWNVSHGVPVDMNFMWRYIHAHDNPAGILQIVVYGQDTITYTLADGITASVENKTVYLSGAINGLLLISNGVATVNGNTITVKVGELGYEYGNYSVHAGSVVFVRTTEWRVPQQIRNKIMEGIEEGKVAGELCVCNGTHDFVNYSYQFQVQVKVQERNRLQLQVSSENPEGKVMVINANKEDLQYDAQHKIIVKFDGQMAKETTVDDVMAGGTEAKYAVVDNGDYVSVLVYIPHFSTHTIDIESQSTDVITTVTSNPLMIAGIAIAVIAIIAAAVIIKKR